MNYGVSVRERGKNVYYSVSWSPLTRADRWTINAKVPSVGGIYEIYWMDEHRHLRMLSVGDTHYGGLRTELRRLTDPELTAGGRTRQILENNEIWFRYAPTDSPPVMSDVVWFFRRTYFPENPGVSHSGRYEKIFLKETEPDKLVWIE
ncbi:MAG: hypothetical protein LBB77_02365 [Treponema sp.]|jgi:hypothetical protein|nr:hypothetical protein [Treponema sp.]